MEELIKKIEQWGYDRNLQTANSLMQTTKTLEECIELQQAIINLEWLEKDFENVEGKYDNHEYLYFGSKYKTDIKDAIGDIFVTLVMLSIQNEKVTLHKADHCNYLNLNMLEGTTVMIDCVTSAQTSLIEKDYDYVNEEIGYLIYIKEQIAIKYNLTLKECIEYAYEQIKDRKGKMTNGLWVKEA